MPHGLVTQPQYLGWGRSLVLYVFLPFPLTSTCSFKANATIPSIISFCWKSFNCHVRSSLYLPWNPVFWGGWRTQFPLHPNIDEDSCKGRLPAPVWGKPPPLRFQTFLRSRKAWSIAPIQWCWVPGKPRFPTASMKTVGSHRWGHGAGTMILA